MLEFQDCGSQHFGALPSDFARITTDFGEEITKFLLSDISHLFKYSDRDVLSNYMNHFNLYAEEREGFININILTGLAQWYIPGLWAE
jgi:hypothetical protein